MKNKLVSILLLCIFYAQTGHSQNIFLKAMEGFNDLAEGIEKLASNFNKIDNNINKDRVKLMVSDLYYNIGEVILVKQSIILKLQNNTTDKPDYRDDINNLQNKLWAFSTTIKKYDDLIKLAEVNTQQIQSAVRNDLLAKMSTLENARGLYIRTESIQNVRKDLITYFKSGINILKHSQNVLSKFKT